MTETNGLIGTAELLLRQRYIPRRHVVASALRVQDGQVFTGLHIGANVARASLCAEVVALSQAILNGSSIPHMIVAVHHLSDPGSEFACEIVRPCGTCLELLSDYAPRLQVVILNGRGEPMSIQIADLLPYKFVRPQQEVPLL